MDNYISLSDVNNLTEVSKLWLDRSKILIMSFEDQSIDKMNMIAETLKNRCNKLYKIIILRDILNCFSSRFQALCDRENTYDDIDNKFYKIVNCGVFFKTDYKTIKLWLEHHSFINNSDYIIFNYNMFLCKDINKIAIFDQLDIPFSDF